MAAIDIGVSLVSADETDAALYTIINQDNPANDSGIITDVEIEAVTAMTGCMVGTFYATNGTTFKCRDSATLGNVASGKQDFAGLSIDVVIGDYIGSYCATGTVARKVTASNRWYVSGQFIDKDDETTYTLGGSRSISVYGTGSSGATHEGAVTLAGTGTFAGIGRGIFIGKATTSGTGSLAAIGGRIRVGLATLSGSGTLAGIGRRIRTGAAALSGVGTLVVAGTTSVTHWASATLSGAGTMAVKGFIIPAIAIVLKLYKRVVSLMWGRGIISDAFSYTFPFYFHGAETGPTLLEIKLFNRTITIKKKTRT